MLALYLQMLDTPEEKVRFEEIYRKYRGLMYHVAHNVLHNRQDAEDAVHNAFLRMLRHFRRYQTAGAGDLAPQIAVLARNEAISLLRKKREEVPLEEEAFSGEIGGVTDYRALVDTFTRLPQTYRAAMEMKLLLGYSDGEIAARLGLSKTAVSTRLHRGRLLLRSIVEQEGFLPDA